MHPSIPPSSPSTSWPNLSSFAVWSWQWRCWIELHWSSRISLDWDWLWHWWVHLLHLFWSILSFLFTLGGSFLWRKDDWACCHCCRWPYGEISMIASLFPYCDGLPWVPLPSDKPFLQASSWNCSWRCSRSWKARFSSPACLNTDQHTHLNNFFLEKVAKDI